MRFSPLRLFFVSLLAALSCTAFARPASAPVLAAKSWVLIDYPTGRILAGNEPDSRVEPASLTKLMTAYLSFAALKAGTITEDQTVPVSQKAWKQQGSRMFIEPRKPVTAGELIRGLIIQSGNDASVALAELLAGTEENFATLMNREAERLGMKNSHFKNSNGLSHPEHYTTARDLTILASALIRDFPEHYSLYSTKSFTYNRIEQPNRNRLLWLDPTVDGMKTGQTDTAGYCLVSSAKRGPRRLISVVLGAASENVRAQESLKLLNYGFQFYDTVRVYAAEQALSQFQVWKGQEKQVNVGFTHDFLLALPRDKAAKIEAVLESRQPVLAPLTRGQQIGLLKLSVGGESYGEYPVVALANVPLGGFFSRLWDAILLWFKSL